MQNVLVCSVFLAANQRFEVLHRDAGVTRADNAFDYCTFMSAHGFLFDTVCECECQAQVVIEQCDHASCMWQDVQAAVGEDVCVSTAEPRCPHGAANNDTECGLGCTFPSCSNYNENATIDDGSCTFNDAFEGAACRDSFAANFNPNATLTYPGAWLGVHTGLCI